MTFDEIDFPNAVWRVPKERMKMREPHEVPLSDAAIAVLRVQEALPGSKGFVFPGRPHRPLSSMAMAALMKRMGVAATVHGFRSSARSWMADNAVPFELAEATLAHAVGGTVAAYQRSNLLDQRRPVLQAWANYICGETGDNVVPLRARAASERLEDNGLEAKPIIYDGGSLGFKGQRWADLVVWELVQAGAVGASRLSALAAGACRDDHRTYFLWQRLVPQFQQCSGLCNELDVIGLTVRSNSPRRDGAPMVKSPDGRASIRARP